ncbi:gamma-glutamyltransferase [Granulicella tundricola]|nr:gamma-glutamyltransferase [Granulicella tundricola]
MAVSAGAAPQKHAMVVSIHHDASDAGLEILKQGGNAVDAAVAVGFALSVVLPQAGNLGGGGFMLIRDHNGEAHFLDFREKAPAGATPNMYLDQAGNIIPGLSTRGYLAIGVPGSVAGFAYAQKHYGKLTLAQDMAPAIKLAKMGYTLSEEEARALHSTNLTKFPESHRIFQRDGDYYKTGDTFVQPELAKTLQRLAANPQEFYTGPMAKQLADTVHTHGGLLTEADLAAYTVADRKPLVGHYSTGGQKYDVVTSPPPSSGGIVLLEVLNMLSGYDLPKLGGDRSEAQMHIITEAFRRAYMDRGDYLGDPDYTVLPLAQMGNERYASAWRKTIDPVKPTPSAELRRPAGFMPPPPAVTPVKESTQTTHFSVVDSDGNAVSTTYTLNGLFGCGATAEGLGFLLNNEMDDFSSKPGSPNMFGLIQGPANAIAPGHRPLSSMTPTIVTAASKHGKPGELRLVLGSPGGSTIITTVINDLLSILVNGLSVQAAADAPRFHHQYLPDVLDVEKAFPVPVVEELRAAGYKVSRANEADEKNPGVWGDSELIEVNPKTGALEGGHDNRRKFGKVASY